jgi:hypothetical protein
MMLAVVTTQFNAHRFPTHAQTWANEEYNARRKFRSLFKIIQETGLHLSSVFERILLWQEKPRNRTGSSFLFCPVCGIGHIILPVDRRNKFYKTKISTAKLSSDCHGTV